MKTGPHTFSRRDFLTFLGSAAGGFALIPHTAFSQMARPFNMLVVGDSMISGQGLGESERSYYLVKQWLETEALKVARPVSLKVKAHSGASINLRPAEAEALKKAGITEDRTFPGEVNISFPSIRAQLDAAHAEYQDPRDVDLIILSGGITDIRLSVILDPFRR